MNSVNKFRVVLVIIMHCALCIVHSSAQNPLVKVWDYRYGGSEFDGLSNMQVQQTKDGGFILGGSSQSAADGDKTQPSIGAFDYWIIKTDPYGIKQWDKVFGGTSFDILKCLRQTSDGGYILIGNSRSGISGDKTEPNWDPSGQTNDLWIVKIDSLGTKQWDKDFGGTNQEGVGSIEQTNDGGYILGGYSYSGISGNKTGANWDPSETSADYWIVKIDSLGNKQWDKVFGGTYHDALTCIRQTSDGGYIAAGFSESGISGNKTQACRGQFDYWIVKIDSAGTMLWDRVFGGLLSDDFTSIQETRDGGFIIGGRSVSDVGGDKTTANWGSYDFWIVKTDGVGNYQWDKDFGGTDGEAQIGNVYQTSDNGYLLCGLSYSPISGNKTQDNLGPNQTWVVRTDSSGNFLWDKTLLTNGFDSYAMAIQLQNGCYAILDYTSADIGGDKSQPSWGVYDYWLTKFCDSTLVPVAAFTSPTQTCPGTCIDFANLSLNATNYHWFFPGGSPDTSSAWSPTGICYSNPGSYDVMLIASGPNGSDTLMLTNTISVYPQPSPQGILQVDDTLFANPGAVTYQWYFDGNVIPGATESYYAHPSSGDYNVFATDTNGCEVEAAIFGVIGVEEIFPNMLKVYPNPVQDKFTIQSQGLSGSQVKSGAATEITIRNVFGERIFSAVHYLPYTVDCQLFPAGLYCLEVISDKKIYRTKFVKSTYR